MDVVARDKKGPVIDLTQADFEVYEDGKLQQIATFERRAPDALLTRVGGEAATGVGTREAAMPPVVVALAWDRLSPEGRVLANKAAQSFVSTRQGNELVGVFIVDQSLRTVEGYTTDEAKLKAAVERVAGTATMPSGRERDALRDSRVAHPSVPVTAGAEFAGGVGLRRRRRRRRRARAPIRRAIGAADGRRRHAAGPRPHGPQLPGPAVERRRARRR